jgi:hypothetical protein
VHNAAWAEPGDGWWVDGKVSTRCIHGPRRTRLTRLRAPTRSEEGRRRGCGAHRRSRRCQAARGAALSYGEAPGYVHENRKWVRRLGTDGVVETEARCGGGGGGLSEADKRRWRGRDATGGWGTFIRARTQREREGDGMAQSCTRKRQRGRVVAGVCVEVTLRSSCPYAVGKG